MRRFLAVVLLTFVLSMQASTSRATTPARDFGDGAYPFLMSPSSLAAVTASAPAPSQDPTGVEASLDLDRSTRQLIQHGLRNEGFNPGTPDGLFGPRTRGAIRDWQRSRGAPPTEYLNRAEAERLRAAAAPPPAVPGASPPLESVPPSASLAPPTPASRTADATAARTPATTEVELQNIGARRRPRNKLGFALQLCVLRHPGRLLTSGEFRAAGRRGFRDVELDRDVAREDLGWGVRHPRRPASGGTGFPAPRGGRGDDGPRRGAGRRRASVRHVLGRK